MKYLFSLLLLLGFEFVVKPLYAQEKKQLFMDVHYIGAGKLTTEAAAQAHAKDLATEGKYHVKFLKYWVDTAKGAVYCLSSAYDSASIRKTHAEEIGRAHV